MEEEKKKETHFSPFSTPAICYCGCSASCAYIFFLVHCLGTIFQFIVKLKTQYNSIQFRNHTHTIKFITRIFSPSWLLLVISFCLLFSSFSRPHCLCFWVCVHVPYSIIMYYRQISYVCAWHFFLGAHCFPLLLVWCGVVGCYRCRCYIAAIRADGRRSIELFVVCILYILKYKHI